MTRVKRCVLLLTTAGMLALPVTSSAAGASNRPDVAARLRAVARRGFEVRGFDTVVSGARGSSRGRLTASAGKTVVIQDAVGDALDSRGDVVAAAASVNQGVIAFATAVDQITDPSIDQSWQSGGTAVLWGLDTNNDSTAEYIAVFTGDGAGGIAAGIVDARGNLVCRGAAVFDPVNGYAAGFAKGCPPRLVKFRWATAMLYDFDPTNPNSPSVDAAPDSGWAGTLIVDPGVGTKTVHRSGYWMLGRDGSLYAFGDAPKFQAKVANATAMTTCRDGKGALVVNAAGGVFAFGSARWDGGYPMLAPQEKITAISANPACNGYWLFSNRGRAFAMGVAFYGDMSHVVLNGPVVASVATPSGRGYYMLGTDGGIFGFGDARFHGSMAHAHLNKPIVGMAPTPDNSGYWEVGSDGGVFGFHAPFRGSMGGVHLNRPINGIVAFGNGYLMVASDGGVFGFSNQHFLGSLAAHPPTAPIIGIAAFTT